MTPSTSAIHGLRKLGRRAEWLDLEQLAFDLFFAAARLEAHEGLARVRNELEYATVDAAESGVGLLRRAFRLLDRVNATPSARGPAEAEESADAQTR